MVLHFELSVVATLLLLTFGVTFWANWVGMNASLFVYIV